MIHLNFLLYILSFATATVSITVSTLIYLHYRKKVIIYYIFLLIVVTLLLIYRMIHCYVEMFSFANAEGILMAALILKKMAFLLGLFYGPKFCCSLIGLNLSRNRKIINNTLGVVYLVVTIGELLFYSHTISSYIRLALGIPILFGVFAYHIVLAASYLGKLGDKILNLSLKIFFILALIIFPFSLYQNLTQKPFLPNFIEIPLAFLVLNFLTIIFSFKYFNKPAYFMGNQITPYFKSKFAITERESEIIALVIKGLSNQDIGKKLFISSRTVESHLYKVFQKADIKNRTQLINLILSNRE